MGGVRRVRMASCVCGAQGYRFVGTTAPSRARLQEEDKACRSTRTGTSGTATTVVPPRAPATAGRRVLTVPPHRARSAGRPPGMVVEVEAARARLEVTRHGARVARRGAVPVGHPLIALRVARQAARAHRRAPVTRGRAGHPGRPVNRVGVAVPVVTVSRLGHSGVRLKAPLDLTGRLPHQAIDPVLRSSRRTSSRLTSIASPAGGCAP